MKVARKSASGTDGDVMNRSGAAARARGAKNGTTRNRAAADGPTRSARPAKSRARTRTRPHEPRSQFRGPQTVPAGRPAERLARATSATQAKARAKVRKAKAPKAIRPPLRERLIARLARLELSPRALLAKIPFVVLVIGALAVGLVITLWLSTDAAQRSYQLGNARALNDALTQQKEALERDVLVAQSAPALADAARNLGMIPSRDTAHLVLDPAGHWVVVGQPKPAEGAPPPPLNTKLPDDKPPAPAKPAPVQPALPPAAAGAVLPQPPGPVPPGSTPGPVPPGSTPGPVPPGSATGPELAVLVPSAPGPSSSHLPAGALPGPPPAPGPATPPQLPGDTRVIAPAGPVAPPVPTVADVSPVPPLAAASDIASGASPAGVPR